MHSPGDELAHLYTKLESTLVRKERRGQFWAKYRYEDYEIYYLPQILRVYGYQIYLHWVKKWPHEPWEMLANMLIPWSIWVLYVSSVYTWNLKKNNL